MHGVVAEVTAEGDMAGVVILEEAAISEGGTSAADILAGADSAADSAGARLVDFAVGRVVDSEWVAAPRD